VVKIGGSLLGGRRLHSVLRIVGAAAHPVVVVPGGGPFADAVRSAQKEVVFSDRAAHHMAILGMHQMAHILMDFVPRLTPAEQLAQFDRAWNRSRLPVWLPARLAARDRRIPADWSITSDGLAARLAERLGAGTVVLVKSRRLKADATLQTAREEGVVDAAFADIVERAGLDWVVIGPGQDRELARMLGVNADG
jgi:aspartokinase-like uncharacterized kinase